jgi:hypothetical protein
MRMKEGNAAGRKTEEDPIGRMENVMVRLGDAALGALTRAESDDSGYDSRGRLRDYEIANAVKLGVVGAQLATALVRLRRDFRGPGAARRETGKKSSDEK